MDDDRYDTMDSVLPKPSKAVELAIEHLARIVDADGGTLNGWTPLYWNLLNIVQRHMKRKDPFDEIPVRG